MPVCASCGQGNPARARFCMSCAAPLPREEPAPPGARKTVTVLFCDVVGSTALAEQLDPESVREVMTRFFQRMRAELERHGGTVEKFIGDAVMAVFGVPMLHEDDALRAVRAAHAMRESLEGLNAELETRFGTTLRTRIGVNTGEVVVGDPTASQGLVLGDAVNVAARLEQAAEPGEILLGPSTFALVRDHVATSATEPFDLKGKREPLHAHRLRSVDPGPDAIGARPEPPLVGREGELAELRSTFDRVVAGPRCALVTVVGTAGVGKSRLAREFAASIGPVALVLRARCLPYGEGITFWPVAELVKQACDVSDDESREGARAKIEASLAGAEDDELTAERLAGMTGIAESDADLQETFWAVRRFLEWLGRDRPVVAILDDVQWAEPAFLDLVEYLAGRTRDTALLLLCLARPDLIDVRPSWGTGAHEVVAMPLGPLGEDETTRFVEGLLGRASLDERVLARISEAAGGNPLFLEEMLRMLEDDGLLRREGERWVSVGDVDAIRVPQSIQALLAARLDRLSEEERAVIRCASVVGKVFWWGAVADLAPESVAPRVGSHLQTLVRKELIRPERSTFTGEDAFRFHHILIQEAAYRATPKEQRAELHEQFATWTERAAGDRATELEEVIGYHLEQAVLYRTELGAAEESVRPLAIRAARPLAAAGMRATDRRDVFAAADLLRRAAELFPPEHPERRPVLLALGETLLEIGDLGAASAILDEAETLARSADDERTAANAAIQRLFLMESTDPKLLSVDALSEADRLIATLEALGDDLGVARAWLLVADLHWTHSRYGAADDALTRAIEHARWAGARREEADAVGRYTGTGAYGPAPAEEVERRCREVLQTMTGTGYEAPALRALASVCAWRGRFDEARELAHRARAVHEDLGLRLRAMFVAETSGAIEMLAGDPVAAERELRAGLDAADEMGEQGFRSTVAALLAHALVEQGRLDEAEQLAGLSEKTGAEDDVATQVMWRSALARVLAARNRAEEAEPLIRAAVIMAEETDDLNMRGDTLVALGEVLAAAADPEGAGAALAEALERFAAKGNEVAAGSTRRRLEALPR